MGVFECSKKELALAEQTVGLQLYTVRDETARDFKLTLRRVSEMGYPAVEFAGYGNIDSKDMAALLADFGLRAAGSHVALAALEKDIEQELNYCLDIGCTYVIIPWLAPELRQSEQFLGLAACLNRLGKLCKERGLVLAYHNHNFEFVQQDGKYLLDTLLDATDPELVKLELDTYWAAHAGVDPVAYLRHYSGRVPLIHVKDMTPERSFTEVGSGMLDIRGYCEAARGSGAHYYIVENDAPTIPSLESARRSLEYLRTNVLP